MDQDASYGSPNFQWFRKRYSRFVYIDRVIVGTAFRRQGLAQALYAHLFETARAAGQTRVVCEVNAEPANPVSDAFHAALGFQPVGLAALPNGKTVRYLERLG
jgi:predicted GNAT superfamily acetyltransferase